MPKLKQKREESRARITEKTASQKTKRSDWQFRLLVIFGLLAFLVVYLLRLDRVVGMFMDDAWYALLGKALATGQGYTLINSPTPGILPLYPPAYPFLLALAFKIWPQFPPNIYLLKTISILAMLLMGGLTYLYLERYRQWQRWTALLVALVAVLNPGLAFMATSSLMSECVFAAALMLALVLVEECVRRREGERFWLLAVLAGVACSAAFLTRSMALGLVVAALLYLAKERLFKTALVFAATVMLLLGSWTLYTQSRKPTAEQRAEVNNYIVRPYSEQFWDRLAGHESAGRISLSDLPQRLVNNISSILRVDASGILLPAFFPWLNQGMAERGSGLQMILSLLVCSLIICGYTLVVRERIAFAELALPLSIAIIILWPFPPYRFLLPALPLLLFYFLQGTKVFWYLHQRLMESKEAGQAWATMNGFAWVLLVIALLGNINYVMLKQSANPLEHPRFSRIFAEQEMILKWIVENLSKDGVIVTPNPALVSLYTGHRTTAFNDPEKNWEHWRRLGVRYLVHLSPSRIPEPNGPERQFRVVHRSGGELNLRVTDLGLPNTRPAWGNSASSPTKIDETLSR